jgi:hypothetical protein
MSPVLSEPSFFSTSSPSGKPHFRAQRDARQDARQDTRQDVRDAELILTRALLVVDVALARSLNYQCNDKTLQSMVLDAVPDATRLELETMGVSGASAMLRWFRSSFRAKPSTQATVISIDRLATRVCVPRCDAAAAADLRLARVHADWCSRRATSARFASSSWRARAPRASPRGWCLSCAPCLRSKTCPCAG